MSEKGDENAAAEVPAESSDAAPSVSNMPSGEYLLHVLVETGKNIGMDGEDTVDPLVTVKLNGKSKDTGSKPDVTRG
jgi:hypothetical protein